MTINQSNLQTLATSNPHWQSFASTLPPALLTAETPLPSQLAEDTANLLRATHPELIPYLDSPPPSRMQTLNPIPIIFTIGALLFLLRTHISFERSESGKIIFRAEHKGMDNELVIKIIDSLKDWIQKSK